MPIGKCVGWKLVEFGSRRSLSQEVTRRLGDAMMNNMAHSTKGQACGHRWAQVSGARRKIQLPLLMQWTALTTGIGMLQMRLL